MESEKEERINKTGDALEEGEKLIMMLWKKKKIQKKSRRRRKRRKDGN